MHRGAETFPMTIGIMSEYAEYSYDQRVEGSKELDRLLGAAEMRPYERHYREIEMQRKRPILDWINANIFKSVFFLGLEWVAVIYAIQVGFVLAYHFELLDSGLFPENFLVTVGVTTLHTFLLTMTVTNVVTSNRSAVYSFLQNILGWATQVSNSLLSVLDETQPLDTKKHDVLDYSSHMLRKPEKRLVSTKELLIECRHIVASIIYAMYKLGREGFDLEPDRISTLTPALRNELAYAIVRPSNALIISKLQSMFMLRLDVLYKAGSTSQGTQSPMYTQASSLGRATGDFEYANSDLNKPRALLSVLTITTWAILLYYPTTLFSQWGLWGSLAVLIILDVVFHGMLMFVRLYNNPFELSVKKQLTVIKFSDMAHDTVCQMDQIFLHIILSTEAMVKEN